MTTQLTTPIQTSYGYVRPISCVTNYNQVGTAAVTTLTYGPCDAQGCLTAGSNPVYVTLTATDLAAYRAAMPSGMKAALDAALLSNQPSLAGTTTST